MLPPFFLAKWFITKTSLHLWYFFQDASWSSSSFALQESFTTFSPNAKFDMRHPLSSPPLVPDKVGTAAGRTTSLVYILLEFDGSVHEQNKTKHLQLSSHIPVWEQDTCTVLLHFTIHVLLSSSVNTYQNTVRQASLLKRNIISCSRNYRLLGKIVSVLTRYHISR